MSRTNVDTLANTMYLPAGEEQGSFSLRRELGDIKAELKILMRLVALNLVGTMGTLILMLIYLTHK